MTGISNEKDFDITFRTNDSELNVRRIIAKSEQSAIDGFHFWQGKKEHIIKIQEINKSTKLNKP